MMWKNEAQVILPKITEVHFTPVRPRSGLVGFVNFVINDAFAVSGIGVHTRPNGEGIRLLYPTKTLYDGTDVNLFHPISRHIGKAIEEAVYPVVKKMSLQVEI